MIEITNTDVFGWESAIRGMRNPMNSWGKSDSYFDWCEDASCLCPREDYVVGNNDLTLMKKLSKAGSDHAKYKRMINVTCDIIAPLYWWKEFDTYKVGTVANSCSTMHKIHEKEFTLEDFSLECVTEISGEYPNQTIAQSIVNLCENYRKEYLRTQDKRVWKALIQLLPNSYNQKRTIQLNYEVLTNMYYSRKNHKLDEWREFCRWIESLPYSELITEGRK